MQALCLVRAEAVDCDITNQSLSEIPPGVVLVLSTFPHQFCHSFDLSRVGSSRSKIEVLRITVSTRARKMPLIEVGYKPERTVLPSSKHPCPITRLNDGGNAASLGPGSHMSGVV